MLDLLLGTVGHPTKAFYGRHEMEPLPQPLANCLFGDGSDREVQGCLIPVVVGWGGHDDFDTCGKATEKQMNVGYGSGAVSREATSGR
jgi:hypothetical protein